MKKKSVVCFLLVMCLIFSFVMFSACGEKDTIDPPVISEIYQDLFGKVCVKHNGLKNAYNPEFSLDGETWCQTQLEGDKENVVSIMTYNSQTNKFEYRTRDGENVEIEATTIQVALRESETATTKATEPSNIVEFVMKTPQVAVPNISSDKSCLGDSHQSLESANYDGINYIVYDKTQAKFVFAVKEKQEGTRSEYQNNVWYDYKYVATNSIANNMEYCFLNVNNYTDRNSMYNKVDEEAMNGTLTFASCTTRFSLDMTYAYESQLSQGEQCVTMAIRYKGSGTLIPSKCVVLEIAVYKETYFVTYDNIPLQDGFELNTNQDNLVLKLIDSVVEWSAVENALKLYKTSNYEMGAQQEITDKTIVSSNGTNDITSADAGKEVTLEFKVSGQTVLTKKMIILV